MTNFKKLFGDMTPQDGSLTLSLSLSGTWMTSAPTRVTMTHPHRKKVNLKLHQVKQVLYCPQKYRNNLIFKCYRICLSLFTKSRDSHLEMSKTEVLLSVKHSVVEEKLTGKPNGGAFESFCLILFVF